MAFKKRASSKPEEKMVLNISVEMSSILIDYALSKSPSPNNLANFKNLLESLDIETYKYNYDIYNYFASYTGVFIYD